MTGDSGDGRYMYLSGTSMATPLVAGCCAVLREMLADNGYKDEENGIINPKGSLIKALLINGAVPVKGQHMPHEVHNQPNPHSGFGRVNLSSSLVISGDLCAGYEVSAILEDDEQPIVVNVSVPKAAQQKKQFFDHGGQRSTITGPKGQHGIR